MFSLSGTSCTASPDQPRTAVESPLTSAGPYSLPVKRLIWPSLDAFSSFSIAASAWSLVAFSGSMPSPSSTEPTVSRISVRNVTLPLNLGSKRSLMLRQLAPGLVLAVDQQHLARLPRHRDLPLGIEVGARDRVFDVLDRVRHLALVELLHEAEPVHPAGHPVGHDVQIAAARVALRVLLAHLAEELDVVVDLLDVLDRGAVLLLELVEGRVLLSVDVHVVRPVRERERLRRSRPSGSPSPRSSRRRRRRRRRRPGTRPGPG